MEAPKRRDLSFKIENGFTFYIFPKGKSLYHGTIANTEKDPSNYNKLISKLMKMSESKSASKLTDIYDTINTPLYLSHKRIADKYGCNRDTSRIVTALHHSMSSVTDKPNKKHIVPLYYVEGQHGITIEFVTIKPLKLFDLGNLDNMKRLVAAINNSNTLSQEKKTEFIERLSDTCFSAQYDKDYNVIAIKECKRKSDDLLDPDLVNIICSLWKKDLNLPDIDGWIYFETPNSNFHFEVLLCNPFDLIEYKKIYTLPDTKYEGLPTWDEFRISAPKITTRHKTEIMLTNNNMNRLVVDYTKSESLSPFFDASQNSY
jgi:hypothetical protein